MVSLRKCLAVLLPAIVILLACRAAQVRADVKLPPLELKDTRLDNGLRVILVPDHSAPVYAIDVSYNVGSRNEKPGHTGFAHLFEHMMFQGSQNVGKGEHFMLVLNNGGNMNGTTTEDRTIYFEELPKNQLDLGLFLEADRMRSLNITQANLDNQRKTVQEERRQSIDNQPYGRAELDLDSLSYDNFAYKHSTIGSMADLDAASIRTYPISSASTTRRITRSSRWSAISIPTMRWPGEKIFRHDSLRSPRRPKSTCARNRITASAAKPFTTRWRACRDIDIAYHIPAGNTPETTPLQQLADDPRGRAKLAPVSASGEG